mgnify:CR=1 FL=1
MGAPVSAGLLRDTLRHNLVAQRIADPHAPPGREQLIPRLEAGEHINVDRLLPDSGTVEEAQRHRCSCTSASEDRPWHALRGESAVVPCPYRSRADRPPAAVDARHLLGRQLAPAGPAEASYFEGATLAGRGTIPGARGEPEWCATILEVANPGRASRRDLPVRHPDGQAGFWCAFGRDLAPQCQDQRLQRRQRPLGPHRRSARSARPPVFRFDLAGIGDSSGSVPKDVEAYWNGGRERTQRRGDGWR